MGTGNLEYLEDLHLCMIVFAGYDMLQLAMKLTCIYIYVNEDILIYIYIWTYIYIYIITRYDVWLHHSEHNNHPMGRLSHCRVSSPCDGWDGWLGSWSPLAKNEGFLAPIHGHTYIVYNNINGYLWNVPYDIILIYIYIPSGYLT